MSVKLRASGWEFGGKHLPWTWGQINYWDLDRSRWRDVLRAYREAGHAVVSTSVLPRVHRTPSKTYDFEQPRPQTDLLAFLNEVQQCGLKAVLWLGPRDVPGVAAAGYPEDLLTDETALAVNGAGTSIASQPTLAGDVFPLLSLVSEPLRRVLGEFGRALLPVLAPFVHPDGPVIGLGLTQAPGWAPALGAWDADFHPASLALYRAFLKKNYKKIQALISAYGEVWASFETVEPPAPPAPGAFPNLRQLDWARFHEEYFIHAAEILHGIFSPLALDRIPLFLSAIPANGCPANGAELERSRCFDYAMPELPLAVSHSDLVVDFLSPVLSLSRFAAWFQARPEAAPEDAEKNYALLCGLAGGVRAWDALSPAGSGPLPGFLLDRQGSLLHRHQQVWDTIRENARLEGFLNSQLAADVFLLNIPDYERAKYLETPPAPRYDLMGVEALAGLEPKPVWDPATRSYAETQAVLEKFLNIEHYAYLKIDGSKNGLDRVTPNQVLLVPSQRDLPAALQATLVEMLDKGVSIILAGAMPSHPEGAAHTSLEELSETKPKAKPKGTGRAKAVKAGRLFHWEDPGDPKLSRVFKQAGVTRELTLEHPGLKLTVHKFRNRIFIAVINPAAEAVETRAHREGKFVLKDFWNAKKYFGGNHEIKLSLPARSVKFWELIPC